MIGSAAFGIAAGVHGIFHALGEPQLRPIPSLAVIPWSLAGFACVAMVVSAVGFVRRARGALRRAGLILAHIVIVLGGLVGVLTSDPEFPFGEHYVESIELPEGRGTAYLYKGGFFCAQTVWLAEPGRWWATRDPEVSGQVCNQEAHLLWNPERREVWIVGPGGEVLPTPPSIGDAFHWGPH